MLSFFSEFTLATCDDRRIQFILFHLFLGPQYRKPFGSPLDAILWVGEGGDTNRPGETAAQPLGRRSANTDGRLWSEGEGGG